MTVIDRYGAEIEADFHREYGLDLLDFFRGRHSWRKLADLIRRLPPSSLTTEAMAEDDELADQIVDRPEQPGAGPRVSEYTAEVARLDLLADRISELIAVVVQVAGGKAPRVRPARRPETALTRAQQRRATQRVGSLIAEVEAAQQRWAEENS